MLTLPGRVRVFVSVAAVDFRWGFDRLCARVRDAFGDDPLSGHWYVFFNRSRNRVKILTWDQNGFWLFYKRLERGTFERLGGGSGSEDRVEVDRATFTMLLEGIDLKHAKRREPFAREIRLSPRHGERTTAGTRSAS